MQEIKQYADIVAQEFKKVSDVEFKIIHTNWSYSFFAKLKDKKASKNKFKLVDIIELNSLIPELLFDSTKSFSDDTKKKKVEVIHDRTGLYHFVFEEKGVKEHIVYCCFMNNINEQLYLYAGSLSTVEKIKEILKEQKKKQFKPQLGIFTGKVDDKGVLHYVKFEKQMSKKNIHHSVKKDVLDDIKHFYKNIDQTIANKEKGTRKVLLAGNQGTGKSTIIQEITLDHFKDTHSIVYCNDLNTWVKHQELCSKYNIPSIAVVEDCENLLDDRNSTLLNYMSGSLEYSNKKGAYTFFTTNYPQALSDRIKHRPERIDDVFIISNLNASEAVEVAKMYFSQFLPEGFDYSTLKGIFTDATGAEVMKYAQDVKKYANFRLGDFSKIDANFIKKVMEEQKSKYKKLSEINTKKTGLSKSGNGFGNDVGFGGRNYGNDDF